jgi:iron complex transport system substrate-binding protein
MTFRFVVVVLAIAVTTVGSLAVVGQEPVGGPANGFPVTIENCGLSMTYAQAPQRVVTMNQATTELMLELELQDRLVGTAYLDDAILPPLEAAYQKIPVLTPQYPTPDELLAVRPDFVFAAYVSAFSDQGVGPREDLGIPSYLAPSGCARPQRGETVSMATLYREIRDIGRIFGVLPRAERLIASYEAELRATQALIGAVANPPTVFWYDAGSPPSVGACCGMPNEILRLVGARNVFVDKPGSWTGVSWNEVIARNPDVIVLVDSPWSPASEKARRLRRDPSYAAIDAVSHQRFVTIDFSSTTPGIRTVAAVRRLAEALYPERFGGLNLARVAPIPKIR